MFAECHGFLLRPFYALFLFDGFGKKATDLETTFKRTYRLGQDFNPISSQSYKTNLHISLSLLTEFRTLMHDSEGRALPPA